MTCKHMEFLKVFFDPETHSYCKNRPKT